MFGFKRKKRPDPVFTEYQRGIANTIIMMVFVYFFYGLFKAQHSFWALYFSFVEWTVIIYWLILLVELWATYRFMVWLHRRLYDSRYNMFPGSR